MRCGGCNKSQKNCQLEEERFQFVLVAVVGNILSKFVKKVMWCRRDAFYGLEALWTEREMVRMNRKSRLVLPAVDKLIRTFTTVQYFVN